MNNNINKMEAENMESAILSFWQFVTDNNIVIPSYQRDYAQGRKDDTALLIRESLIKDLYEALQPNSKIKDMNFIYGSNDSNGFFSPVDGQQRLTTLYLLHWYIFINAQITEEERTLLGKFSYCTRDSSKHFCENLVKLVKQDKVETNNSILFSESLISEQIKNKPWFTGVMEHDPTVEAMLRTIDCIHNQFRSINDFSPFKESLKSTECKIKFNCLNLQDRLLSKNYPESVEKNIDGRFIQSKDDAIRDLYIKMNARGKSLTDFELFKAGLQKKQTNPDRIDLINEYCSITNITDSPEFRTNFFGTINNKYTNLFFKIIDDGVIKDSSVEDFSVEDNRMLKMQFTDVGMMNYFNEIFSIEYLIAIKQKGQSSYRDICRLLYPVIIRLVGKKFNHFIETGKIEIKGISEEYISKDDCKKIFGNSFLKAINILEQLCAKYDIDNSLDIYQQLNNNLSETNLFKNLGRKIDDLSFSDVAQRFGLFLYINKYGLPNSQTNDSDKRQAYMTWSKFLYCLTTYHAEYETALFKNIDDLIGLLSSINTIFDKIGPNPSIVSVLSAIVNTDENALYYTIRNGQFLEEKIKACLRLKDKSNENNWTDIIVDAESYFKDGHVWPILLLSECTSVDDINRIEIKKLETNKDFILSLFDEKMDLKDEYNITIIEQLLLCYSNSNEQFGHLWPNGCMNKFILGKFKCLFSLNCKYRYPLKQDVAVSLFTDLQNVWIDKNSINDEDLISLLNTKKVNICFPDWRFEFINQDLFSKYFDENTIFSNYIFTIEDGGEIYYMLASKTGRRDCYSAELHSFASYLNNREQYKLVMDKKHDKYLDENNKPNRYIENIETGQKLGFYNNQFQEL